MLHLCYPSQFWSPLMICKIILDLNWFKYQSFCLRLVSILLLRCYFQFLPLNFSLSVGIEINNNPRSKFNFVIAFSDFSWSGLSPTVCSVLGFACRLQNVVKSTKRVENIMHISLLGWSCFLTLFHKTAFWVIWNLFTMNSVRPYLAQNRKSIDLRSCMKSTAFNAV